MEEPAINMEIKKLKVACILDESAYEWFRYECLLIPIGVDDWEETMTTTKPDMLFVQSAWAGNEGQWKYKIADIYSSAEPILVEVVDWCRANGIPTVFWNKEDPYHFDRFIDAAELFDYIFTTDSNSIPRYVEYVGHNKVFPLPFAIQPKLHNPIDKDRGKLGKVAFCGSWYGNGHDDRKKDMEIILKPALNYRLKIYDRMLRRTNNSNLRFPYIYRQHVVDSVPYSEISSIYKKYDIILNVNSVQDSPTMFSSRAVELLGCGISVVSGYALGLEKFFPGLIMLSRNKYETKKHLDSLLKDKSQRDRLAIRGIREVYKNHTYGKRLEFLAEKAGINFTKADLPGVSIITSTCKQKYMDNVFINYQRQNYPNKELIIILNDDAMSIDVWREKAKKYRNVKVLQLDEAFNLGSCLNYGIENASYEYIAKMDDDDYYASEYCGDMMNAFEYSEADIVGKQTIFVYFEKLGMLSLKMPNRENRYTNFVAGSTLFFKKRIFEKVKFSTEKISGSDTAFLEDCISNGFTIYSSDRFNHVLIRHPSLQEHTWKIDTKELLEKCVTISQTTDYITPTTV